MKALKITAIVLVVLYVGIVVAFETMLGRSQPQYGTTLVITTFDDQGQAFDRVVNRLESDGQLYVAANHWPRSWYHRALDNPHVLLTMDGVTKPYLAVPATDAEEERINSENPRGLVFLFITGFPPRYFLRLEPQEEATQEPPAAED